MLLLILVWSAVYLAVFTVRVDGFIPGRTIVDGPLSLEQLGRLKIPDRDQDPSKSRRLRVFMPADGPHINLCKTIMSAVALGYPMPTLLNWDGDYNHPDWHFAGSHIAKLESLLSVIEVLLNGAEDDDDVSEDDLVLLVDAYDIWFQLPPSVLIQRYHQLNREADERVRKQWEDLGISSEFPIPPPRQEIVITTAKDCFPDSNSGSDPKYEHWPESPMPSDLYGENTDRVLSTFDPARKYKNIRPRCVNSGMIMGTIGALKRALERSQEKVNDVTMKGRQLWSDQALIGEVMGEQEMYREWVRSLGASWDGLVAQKKEAALGKDIKRIAEAAVSGQLFEFGIGLDYNFTTIPATCSSEEDGFFVMLNDKEALMGESVSAGVAGGVRVKGIPHELDSFIDADDLLSGVEWGNVPLYTDFYFGVTPVGIHHNAYVDGLKPKRLESWWYEMWYYPQLRELVTRRLQDKQGKKPLAVVTASDDEQQQVVYWAPLEDQVRKSVRVFAPEKAGKFPSIGWDGVCQKPGKTEKWYDELFDDGKGPLEV
ncbi:Fc.00g057250.m01.CDS01 [Cosmosporella sp. VM-42]